MTPPPPFYRDQHAIDTDHLNLLSVFHFVGAGLGALGLLFVGAHFAIMHTVFTNPRFFQAPGQPAPPMPPAEIFSVFKWFYLAAALWMIASVVLNILSGIYLRSGKHRTFCLVAAGINCLHVPLGTVLGVFTMVVLMRPSVRIRYPSAF